MRFGYHMRYKFNFNIQPKVHLISSTNITETAMGTSVNAQINSESDYVTSVNHMCRILAERAFSPIEQYDWLYLFTENYRTERKSLKILHSYTESVIKRRKEEYKKKVIVGENSEKKSKKVKAFLDMLLEANMEKKVMSDNDIRQEVDTFMFEAR